MIKNNTFFTPSERRTLSVTSENASKLRLWNLRDMRAKLLGAAQIDEVQLRTHVLNVFTRYGSRSDPTLEKNMDPNRKQVQSRIQPETPRIWYINSLIFSLTIFDTETPKSVTLVFRLQFEMFYTFSISKILLNNIRGGGRARKAMSIFWPPYWSKVKSFYLEFKL